MGRVCTRGRTYSGMSLQSHEDRSPHQIDRIRVGRTAVRSYIMSCCAHALLGNVSGAGGTVREQGAEYGELGAVGVLGAFLAFGRGLAAGEMVFAECELGRGLEEAALPVLTG